MLIKVKSNKAYESYSNGEQAKNDRLFFYTKCHKINRDKICNILENLYIAKKLCIAIPIDLSFFMPTEGSMAQCLRKEYYKKLLKFQDNQKIIGDQILRLERFDKHVYFQDRQSWTIRSYKRHTIVTYNYKKRRGDNKLFFYRRLAIHIVDKDIYVNSI